LIYYPAGKFPPSLGKGETFLLDSISKGLRSIKDFVGDRITLICRSTNPNVCAQLFKDKDSHARYIIAVNHAKKPQNTFIQVNLPSNRYYVYDLLTGKEILSNYKEGILEIPLKIDSLWGKAMVILLQKPVDLILSLHTKRVKQGEQLNYTIKLMDPLKKEVNSALPLFIQVRDPGGKVREEYGGIRILKRGFYSGSIQLADNDPLGEWEVRVSERISGKREKDKFVVISSPD